MSVKLNTKCFIILIVLVIEYLSLLIDISNPQNKNIIFSLNPTKDSIEYNNTLSKLTSLAGYQEHIYNPKPLNLMLKNTKYNCAEEVLSSKLIYSSLCFTKLY